MAIVYIPKATTALNSNDTETARVKREWKIPDYERDEEVDVTTIKVEDEVPELTAAKLKLIEEQLKYDERRSRI